MQSGRVHSSWPSRKKMRAPGSQWASAWRSGGVAAFAAKPPGCWSRPLPRRFVDRGRAGDPAFLAAEPFAEIDDLEVFA